MNYYKVSINQGVLDINYEDMIEGIAISETEAVVMLRDNAEQRETWTLITEEQFNSYKPQAPIQEPAQTLEERVTQLQSDNLILMDALATAFEEILVLEEKINMLGGTS
ncbi:MAG: hypothetical protein A4E53_00143 [Pelotomaculum sp. PtaB.Bin104]|nr:MAG: hypothetical protein A4E53_00143 [Pelotomaculum sp. PtaB.Bin104]